MPMRTFTQNDPLTDAELDRLGDFLKSCKGGRAMNVEQLDGFFAALIAGPETVMPSEYYGGLRRRDVGHLRVRQFLTSRDGALPRQCRRLFSDVLRQFVGWYQISHVTLHHRCRAL
jgi:Uncharacterised protein family (UPF0149)